MSKISTGKTCSLNDPKVQVVLDRLHREAQGDYLRFVRMAPLLVLDKLLHRNPSMAEARRLKDVYMPITHDQGVLLYLVARSIKARRIVEFGTSFGISTIYLASAVRDNGGGLVIGSEIEPGKVKTARANIEETGLSHYVDVKEGDAQETLQHPGGTLDMVLMDGWKGLYVPIIKMLTPYLRPGAVVLADNITPFFGKEVASYVAHMQNSKNGFQSVTLPLGLVHGTEYSVRM